MRDVTSAAPGPSSRLVTLGAVGGVLAALTGCGIRLEDDAPHVPLLPERSPIEGEEALLRLLAAVHEAALAPVDTSSPVSPLLAPLHRTQATVLHDALRQRGVPEDELPSATPTSGATPTVSTALPSNTASPNPSTPTSAPPPTGVAAVESRIIAAGAGCAAAAEDLRPTLVAILGQAHAAVDLMGAELATSQSSTPVTWSTPEVLVPLLAAMRTSTYFLQVAAARSTRSVRDDWAVGINHLERLTAELVAAIGDGAPAPELGRALPHPVTTPAEAATLATEALSTLLSTFGSTLRSLTDADPESAFVTVPRWLGTVAAQARRHGVPLTAFPGLA
jgi:hypothetical protein